MMFLLYEIHPKPVHPEYGVIDGAYASIWVHEYAQAPAEARAREFLGQRFWDIENLDEAYPVTLDRYEPGHIGRERFEQALLDGIVATIVRWPVGAPDE